jgi:hypothetical protein
MEIPASRRRSYWRVEGLPRAKLVVGESPAPQDGELISGGYSETLVNALSFIISPAQLRYGGSNSEVETIGYLLQSIAEIRVWSR